jgi:hypothetical protein
MNCNREERSVLLNGIEYEPKERHVSLELQRSWNGLETRTKEIRRIWKRLEAPVVSVAIEAIATAQPQLFEFLMP